MTDTHLDTEVRNWQEKLLSRSVRRNRKCDRIVNALGNVSPFQCLEISEGDGAISTKLRSVGGSWKTAVATREASDSLKHSLAENIGFIQDGKLPYEDNTFDRLVIVDALKFIENDTEFIQECHRVLRDDSWVVIAETKRAPASLNGILQNMFGLSPTTRGAKRSGYKSAELFDKLKDGFDVPEIVTYSNGLLESASTIGNLFQKSILPVPCWLVPEQISSGEPKLYKSLYSQAGIFPAAGKNLLRV